MIERVTRLFSAASAALTKVGSILRPELPHRHAIKPNQEVAFMASRYRAAINGFWCRNESWDDALNWDGKHDEVFLDVNTKVVDANGTVLQSFDSESE